MKSVVFIGLITGICLSLNTHVYGQYYLLKGDSKIQPYYFSVAASFANNQYRLRESTEDIYQSYYFNAPNAASQFKMGVPASLEVLNESYTHQASYSFSSEFAVVLPVQFIQLKTGLSFLQSNRYSLYSYDYFSNRGDGFDTIQILRLDYNETALHLKPDVAIIFTTPPIYSFFVFYMGLGPQIDFVYNLDIHQSGSLTETIQNGSSSSKSYKPIDNTYNGINFEQVNFNLFAGLDLRLSRKLGVGARVQKDALIWDGSENQQAAISSTLIHANIRWYIANKSSNYYRN